MKSNIVIFDYIDTIKPIKKMDYKEHELLWKELKEMAAKSNVIIVTGVQG